MSLMPRIWQPARLQLLGQLDVIVERIFGAVGIENVAGVADRAFGQLAGSRATASMATRMFSTQLRQSKMRKRSMPGARRLAHEIAHDIVGIIGVADAVGAAQQHLRQDIGRALAQLARAAPTGLRSRNRMATSKVAPPQHSSEKSCGSPLA